MAVLLLDNITSNFLCYNFLLLLLLLPEDVVVVGVVMGLGVEAGVTGAGDEHLQSITIDKQSCHISSDHLAVFWQEAGYPGEGSPVRVGGHLVHAVQQQEDGLLGRGRPQHLLQEDHRGGEVGGHAATVQVQVVADLGLDHHHYHHHCHHHDHLVAQ